MRHFAILFLVIVLLLPGSVVLQSQTKWFRYTGNPVLQRGPAGAWDNSAARVDRVIRTNTGFLMWYTGYKGGTEAGPTVIPHIGMASSPDGVSWIKEAANPVLDPGPASWDGEGTLRPYVVTTNGTYKMWYTGVGCCPTFRIGYATSTDGVVWTKLAGGNPVLNTGSGWESSGVEHASVVGPDENGGLLMWYQGFAGFQIGLATSTDDTTWVKHPGNPLTEFGNAFYPRIIPDGQNLSAWYLIGTSQPAPMGYATSSDTTTWVPSGDNPVFTRGPSGAWDALDILPGDIVLENGMYHMWYSGKNSGGYQTGYAVSPKGMSFDVTSGVSPTTTSPRVTALWLPPETGMYSIDLLLMVDTLMFVMRDAKSLNVSTTDSVRLTITVSDTAGKRFSAIFSSGGYQRDIISFGPVSSVAKQESIVPENFGLTQNFPNPFNPSTNVAFLLPTRGLVNISVLDILGREIAVLVNEELSAGSYQTTWDATGMASGLYFYRLEAVSIDDPSKRYVDVKKMVLLR